MKVPFENDLRSLHYCSGIPESLISELIVSGFVKFVNACLCSSRLHYTKLDILHLVEQHLPREKYKRKGIPSSCVDQLSRSILPKDIAANLVPLKATGNGNCLFNSASILLIGDESLHGVLRLLTAAEIFLHNNFYGNHPR